MDIFSVFLLPGKKGMEMWQLILMILVIILLFVVIAWYAGLNEGVGGLLNRLGGLM